ncbi:serine hydrolase [Isobaculum melis]|uniref:serine-type D-Ala-D-Ala carboxypeptidase n=1 Tax=Isobaculum melis TaxID=142588 RepID=A0A1H9UKE7_9LACT|nr:serine hydrolase [Isobaculum melis]SES09758.1 D-Ala-D-Ala carboxypeptidase A. Serine peptidase. MEROPS family S11 [Isobaculum melis]
MKSFKKIGLWLTTMTILFSSLMPLTQIGVNRVAAAENPITINAGAALAVDAESGKILFNQNGDEALGIASMTKMVTEYLVLEEVAAGNLSWDQKVSVSDYAYAISQDNNLSNVALAQTKEYTVKELYDAVAIFSANGAAIALAEKIAGSEPAFVDKMREKVESWGIENYQLYNSTGLSNEDLGGHLYPGSKETDENQMSAKSMAIIAQRLLKDYPEILETSKISSQKFQPDTVDEILMENWNWMLPGLLYEHAGVDGLKTGSTLFAGACFTGTATKDGMRIITVVLNAKDADGTEGDMKSRFIETAKLMDYIFANWEIKEVTKSGDTIPEQKTLPVVDGKEDEVKIELTGAIKIPVPKDFELENLEMTFTAKKGILNKKDEIEAPIKKDTEVGTATVKVKGDDLGYLNGGAGEEVKVQTAEDADKANFFVLMGRGIKNFFAGLFG